MSDSADSNREITEPAALDLDATVAMPGRTGRLPGIECPGDMIGRYRLIEPLGEGGFGTVWRAEQKEPIHREVALKVIKAGMDSVEIIARFEAERQALALMDHPNIAAVLDAGTTESGRPFFVMELVKGVPVTTYCDTHRLSLRERLELFIPVCQAVQHAHQKAILHRDLKPTNIMVTEVDGNPVPKVIDFGIAKALRHSVDAANPESEAWTLEGMIVGTPQYMSPEQAGSLPDVDTRSDIYTLGVILHELLTGDTPLAKSRLKKVALDEVLRLVRECEARRPSSLCQPVTDVAKTAAAQRQTDPRRMGNLLRGDLDWILLKTLEKDRSRRYDTANALALDLRRHLNSEPVSAGPPSAVYRLKKLVRRHSGAFAAGAVIALLIVAGLVSSTVLYLREKKARSVAEEATISATIQAKRSAQIAGFLEQILAGVSPEVALGRDTTMLTTLLKSAEERISRELGDQPEVEAELRTTIGRVYSTLGRETNALSQHERARDLLQKILGEEHPDTLTSTNNVAMCWLDLGRLEDAEPLLKQTLDLRRRILGEEDPDTLSSTNNLAGLYRSIGHPEKAEPIFAKLLDIQIRKLGEFHRDSLQTMNNLGATWWELGRHDEAQTLLNRALEISKQTVGRKHPASLLVIHNLGLVYSDSGKTNEARKLLEEAWEERREVLGEDHPDTLNSLTGLSSLYLSLDRHKEAEPLLVKIVEFRRGSLGNEHKGTLSALNNLGETFRNQGKFSQAEPLFVEAVETGTRVHGELEPTVLTSMNNLGLVYQAQGKFTLAEPLLRKAADGRRKTLGDEHTETLSSLNNLAALYSDGGRWSEAEALFKSTLETQRKVLGEAHSATLKTMNNMAAVYWRQRNFPEAERLLALALESQRKVRGDDHPETFNMMNNLGTVLQASSKLDEAEPLLFDAYQGRLRVLGEMHPLTLDSMHNVASLQAARELWSEAETLFRRTLDLRRQLLGEAHPGTQLSVNSLGSCLHRQGKIKQEEELLVHSLDASRSSLGEQHAITLQALTRLVGFFAGQKKWTEAEPLLVEEMKLRRLPDGKLDADGTNAASLLGSLRLTLKSPDEAESPLREAWDARRILMPDQWQRYDSERLLGLTLLQLGRLDEGEPLLRSGFKGLLSYEAGLPPAVKAGLAPAAEELAKLARARGDVLDASHWTDESKRLRERIPVVQPPASQTDSR